MPLERRDAFRSAIFAAICPRRIQSQRIIGQLAGHQWSGARARQHDRNIGLPLRWAEKAARDRQFDRNVGMCLAELVEPAGDHPGAEAFRKAYRSEEHTSELQSLMRISSAVFCLNK